MLLELYTLLNQNNVLWHEEEELDVELKKVVIIVYLVEVSGYDELPAPSAVDCSEE